jgi:hypothetical protein
MTSAFAPRRAAFFLSSLIAWSRFRFLENPESEDAFTDAIVSAFFGSLPSTRTVR